jgi:hypothetical protein
MVRGWPKIGFGSRVRPETIPVRIGVKARLNGPDNQTDEPAESERRLSDETLTPAMPGIEITL